MYSKGHGGNIYDEAINYDFSVNTNPLGMPEDVKEKLKEIRGMKKDTDASKSIENIQKLINKLKRKRNRTIIHLYRNVNRLKKAFPTINTKEITEVLSKKIDIKKLKKKEKNK